jgi:hypothetical protein
MASSAFRIDIHAEATPLFKHHKTLAPKKLVFEAGNEHVADRNQGVNGCVDGLEASNMSHLYPF